MSRSVTIEAWSQQIESFTKGGLRDELRRVMRANAIDIENQAQMNVRSAKYLRTRSGALARSIKTDVDETDDSMTINVRAGGGPENVRHAAAHEFGVPGGIRPRAGKYLAIPMPDWGGTGDIKLGGALTATGSLKGRFNVGSLRNVAGLFVFKAKNGKLYLGWKEGKGIRLGFRLHPGPIPMRAKRYLRDAIDAQKDRLLADLGDVLADGLRPGGG